MSMAKELGITVDGKPVLTGVFKFVGTHGLPLEIILGIFKERGVVVNWPDYILAAAGDGHNPRTIRSRIMAAVSDVHGREYATGFEQTLNKWIPSNHVC